MAKRYNNIIFYTLPYHGESNHKLNIISIHPQLLHTPPLTLTHTLSHSHLNKLLSMAMIMAMDGSENMDQLNRHSSQDEHNEQQQPPLSHGRTSHNRSGEASGSNVLDELAAYSSAVERLAFLRQFMRRGRTGGDRDSLSMPSYRPAPFQQHEIPHQYGSYSTERFVNAIRASHQMAQHAAAAAAATHRHHPFTTAAASIMPHVQNQYRHRNNNDLGMVLSRY